MRDPKIREGDIVTNVFILRFILRVIDDRLTLLGRGKSLDKL